MPRHLLSLVLLSILLNACSTPNPQPPNILLILTDDQGCGDVAFTGNDRLQTPNLDQLRNEGMLLTRFHVAPVCAPTRASLLTGRHHLRTGVRGVIEGREFMVEEEVTIAELLRDAGYRTALYGKWHLGENYPWLPHGQGFDEYIGFRQGSSDYFDIELDNKGTPYPTQGYLTDVFTDLAIEFVNESNNHPFFLYLSYNAPHGPLQVPDHYLEPYKDLPDRTANVYAMMASLDENIGRLLQHLDNTGLSDNTLVLFVSDNGPLFGNANNPETRFNCGLRGQKYDVYQGGIQVPLTARWPGRIAASSELDMMTAHIDILPTVLDFAGVSVPDSLSIDGHSLRPYLESTAAASAFDRVFYMTYPRENVKNKPDGPYPGGMALTGRYKMVNGTELYDLLEDPGEVTNLAESRPDLLDSLDRSYRAFWEEATAERDPYPRTHVGHFEENPVWLNAHFADLSGGLMFQFREDPPLYRSLGVHHDWISKWTSTEAKATWRLHAARPGTYQVSLRYRCAEVDAGAEVQVQFGEASVESLAPVCVGDGKEWRETTFGTFGLSAGDADLTVSTPIIPGAQGIDIDQVVVERLR